MNRSKRKVLLITYYFPPSGGPGVQRPLKLTRQLVKQDWQPIVLTVKEDADFAVRDESLLSWIPDSIQVIRTGLFEPYAFYRRITGKSANESLDTSTLAVSERSQRSLGERFSLFLRSWLFIPDARVGWLWPAVFAGLRLIRRKTPDVILTSGPPNTTHLIGLMLKLLTGRPWVADFRDPWFKYLVPTREHRLPQKIDAWMGRAVVRKADRIVAVCRGVKQELMDSFGSEIGAKTEIITNGYSEEAFAAVEGDPLQHGQFRLTYVGSIYHRYDLRPLLQAIDELYVSDENFRRCFSFVIAGPVDNSAKKWFEKAACWPAVKFLGYQSYFQALKLMKEATVLLLYVMDSQRGKNIPTSKLFEYIGSGRPILALAPMESDAAEIIRETVAGVVVPPNETQKIQVAIKSLFLDWQSGISDDRGIARENRNNYEMSSPTKKLMKVIQLVCNLPQTTTKAMY